MRTNQIFKTLVSNELFFKLLDDTCTKFDTYYQFDMNSYKKGIYDNIFSNFLQAIKPCYYLSKQVYVERGMTYNNITTILRQICNSNKIKYTNHMKYDRSKYCIHYYIYI